MNRFQVGRSGGPARCMQLLATEPAFSIFLMTKFFDRYFSFDGRLARLRFFARSVYLGIMQGVIFLISIPFF